MRSLPQQLLRRQVPAPPFARPALPCPAAEEAAPPLPSVPAPFAPPLPPPFARPPRPVPGHLLQALRSSASCPSSSGPSTRSPRGPDAAMLSHRTPKETTQVFEFSLCLSRACLGKTIVFMYKWRKIYAFLYRRVVPRADPGELAA
jgi:hypothetical protein